MSTPSRSRRRAARWVAQSASGSPAGRAGGSSGLSRVGWPGPSARVVPPTAAASGVHSPLGSPGTYTRVPNTRERAVSDLASADLPVPMTPASSTLGLVITPAV